MGSDVHNKGNYRLRTTWTPEMDRYFIDLMLELVGKGNRIDDNLFSKRAWKHMTTLFNAKFNSQYEKDVLKNRYKTLRNLYRALKNLLENKGFRWDDKRKIVAADDQVWDDYIKENPGARSHRVKTIPYYFDLCKIYRSLDVGLECKGTICREKGNRIRDLSRSDDACGLSEGENSVHNIVDDEKLGFTLLGYSPNSDDNKKVAGCASGMASESLHDTMIDEDYGISVAKGIIDDTPFLSDIGSSIGAHSRTCWQPPMDRYFIDLMLDQVNKGHQVDGVFKKQAWKEMTSSFNVKFGCIYEVDILKNRYKTLRRQYKAIKNLLELDGFAWDDARQMVIADDHVWQDYIKAHTEARKYMTRPVPYFQDLCLICNEWNGDAKDSISSHQNLEIPDETSDIKVVGVYHTPVSSISSYDRFHMEDKSSYSDFITMTTNQPIKRQLEIPSMRRCSKKAHCRDESVVHALCEMATAVSSWAGKGKEDENVNAFPIENVIAAIQALPDMDEDLVLDACDFLEDENKAKTFLALDVKLRKKWLMRKLRPLH